MFSLKYLKSSLQMPALFGGKPVSERTNKRLKALNIVMIVLFIVVPIASFIFVGLSKWLYTRGTFTSRGFYVVMYIIFSSVFSFLQLFIASVLIYAVVSIRMIIGKYGLSKRVNYRMFIINAFGMGLYALSVFVYGGFFFYYAWIYYNKKTTDD